MTDDPNWLPGKDRDDPRDWSEWAITITVGLLLALIALAVIKVAWSVLW